MYTAQEMTTYFGNTISGFVGNKYIVTIKDSNGGEVYSNIRFYAKSVTLPYETLNLVDDIYVSLTTLAKPKNVLSVQTYSDLSVTFRMDSENQIIKSLASIFATNHNLAKFETTKTRAKVSVEVSIYGSDGNIKNSYSYENCEIFAMDSYDLDASDRKFKEYKVTFTCNRIGDSGYDSTKSKPLGSIPFVKTSCSKLLDEYNLAFKKYQFNLRDSNRMVGNGTAQGEKGSTGEVVNSGLEIHRNAINKSGILTAFKAILNSKCPPEGMPTQLKLSNPDNATGEALKKMVYAAGFTSNQVIFVM